MILEAGLFVALIVLARTPCWPEGNYRSGENAAPDSLHLIIFPLNGGRRSKSSVRHLGRVVVHLHPFASQAATPSRN